MRVILALLFSALLNGGAAGARAAQEAQRPPEAAPQGGAAQGEAAEAARLNSEVVKLFGQGKFDEALPLARRAVELRERLHGADHPAVASALYNLGSIHIQRKEFEEAEKAYGRALAVAEKNGAKQADLAGELNTQLGLLRFRAGDYARAEDYQLRAVALKEQARGPTNPNLVPSLLNLAEVHLMRREFDKAEAYLDRVVTTLRAHPPRKDLAAADRIQNYLCPLLVAGESKLAWKARRVMARLRDPERAAARDKEEAAAGGARRVPTSGGVLNGRVLRRVTPDYPPLARAQRISGVVIVALTVSEEGKVMEAEGLCGHTMLREAAVEAVREWRFSPTLLEGKPVKVTGTVTVNFTLR